MISKIQLTINFNYDINRIKGKVEIIKNFKNNIQNDTIKKVGGMYYDQRKLRRNN